MGTRICTKPFRWLELSAGRDNPAYLCCSGWLSKSVGRAALVEPKSLWTSKEASDIRASVIDGSFRYCNRELCPYIDTESNKDTHENPMLDVDDSTLKEYWDAVESPLEFLSPPETINCAYDQSCNLSCPSCRNSIIQTSKEERARLDNLAEAVISSFAHAPVTLYITGSGDPLGSRHYWDLLNSDILKTHPNIKIRLHTNAILLTKCRWEKIKHLHDRITSIEVSIDGASKATYEHNRFPAKWETLLERMEYLRSIKTDHPQISLLLNYVVQANNWREMEDFHKLAESWKADFVKFSRIGNWGTYTNVEYEQVAIHKSNHPEHTDYLRFIAGSPLTKHRHVLIDGDHIYSTKGATPENIIARSQ